MSNPKEKSNDEIFELVKKAQKGDKDAFGEIYDSFVDALYRYIYFRVPESEVEDLLETVFLKVWDKIDQYDGKKASFRGWIYRIAHNLVVDFYRLNRGIEELTESYREERRERNPVHVTENNLNSKILMEALKRLKKEYSQILFLKFIDDLTNAEISKIVNKSKGSLRIMQYRALRQLKKVLNEMGVYDFK